MRILDSIIPPLPPVDRREVLRYAGVRGEGSEAEHALFVYAEEAALPILSPRLCYGVFPIRRMEAGMDLGFCTTDSQSAQKRLDGCEKVLVFAATLGVSLDRLIARESVASPARALFLQALGAERIEALCDAFERDLRARGWSLRERFSPGYGDLPLQLQADIFRALDCAHRIGLGLNASLSMSPSKSVTALVGVEREA